MQFIKRVLVATDFSPDASRASAYGGELTKQLGAHLFLLHVDETAAFVPGSDMALRERRADAEHMEKTLAELRERQVDVEGRVVAGIPEDEILRLALAEHIDLIVVGTRGRSSLLHVLLGSVAEKVLRGAACPVLTVREPDRS